MGTYTDVDSTPRAGSGAAPAETETEEASPLMTFDPTDPEILWILGRPNFVCGPIAHILARGGHEIPRHAEEEQAAVIVWMIRKYQEYGEGWKAKADEDLRVMKAKFHARPFAPEKCLDPTN